MKNGGKLSFFILWAATVSVRAEVVTDGTVGAVQSLSGQMTIPQDLGTTVGNNLFHSFQTDVKVKEQFYASESSSVFISPASMNAFL